jgi:DNA polymerase-3 subunit epsilon
MRAALGNLRAAAETLEAYPEMEIVRRTRLFHVLVEEVERLSSSVSELESTAREARPDPGESVSVDQLVVELEAMIAEPGLRLEVTPADPMRLGTMVAVPARALGELLSRLTRALSSEFGVDSCRLTVGFIEQHLRLDLAWAVPETGPAAFSSWVLDALAGSPRAGLGAFGLREFVHDHRGEVWFAIDRDGSHGHLRFLLPMVASPVEA